MKYFLGFLVSIGLIVAVFILVLKGFSSGSGPKNLKPLTDYDNAGTQMQLTVDGPIAADQNHQGYIITVSEDQTEIRTYQGYQNDYTQTKTYPSNEASYAEFLRALQLAGFNRGASTSSNSDERGYCAAGDRYVYEIVGSDGTDAQRYWSTSCGHQGSFKGNTAQVRSLFQKQVPDFSEVTASLTL